MNEDVLSDVLQAVRLRGAVFFLLEAAAPWVALVPPASEVAAVVMPEADHVMEFHLLVEGECWAGLADGAPERAEAGDFIIFPQGDSHAFRSAPHLPLPRATRKPAASADLPIMLRLGTEGGPGARFVCGYLGCDARPFNPLLEALPRMLRVSARAAGFGDLMRLAVEETASPRPGGSALRARIAEMMFVDAVRTHLAALPAGARGWLGGLRDPQIGRAIGLLHGEPARHWALEDLAREVGMSRTALHERFALLVGQPPMQYLARWRMQLAASLLARGTDKIAAIALDVGYESEAAFNRAFKRAVGLPPAAWRRDRALRHLAVSSPAA